MPGLRLRAPLLEPKATNDSETLGLWGAVHKRLWQLTGDERPTGRRARIYASGLSESAAHQVS
ncbi:MAG: hypothetical protein JWQ44_2330 [Chthoniobacter sp.]|nr:hypothetical protein [Chthoniobacter sp.]